MEQWETADSMQNQPVCLHFGLKVQSYLVNCFSFLKSDLIFFFSLYKDIACLALFPELAKDIFVLKLKLTSGIWAEFLSLLHIAEGGVIDTRCPFTAVRLI